MYQQLELPLWETLKSATSVPEDTDLQEIWFSLDARMAPLDTRQQLQVVGDAITQIAQIVQQRSLLTLEEIQSAMRRRMRQLYLLISLINLSGSQCT